MHPLPHVIVVAFILGSTMAMNRQFPMPDPSFKLHNWLGHWYMLGRIIPCGWSGARVFTDFQMFQCLIGEDVITEDTWRSEGFCTSTIARFSPDQELKGAFTARDQIGGVWSSEVRVVLLDVKNGLNIDWGCSQRDMPKFPGEPPMCKDAWVSVKSRFRKLNPYATHLAYQVLRSLGVYQNDLSQMQFTKPCPFTNQVCPRPTPKKMFLGENIFSL